MSVTVNNLTISPPAAGELCDACDTAKAIVSALLVVDDKPKLLMFCGHHFDAVQRGSKPFRVFNDTMRP